MSAQQARLVLVMGKTVAPDGRRPGVMSVSTCPIFYSNRIGSVALRCTAYRLFEQIGCSCSILSAKRAYSPCIATFAACAFYHLDGSINTRTLDSFCCDSFKNSLFVKSIINLYEIHPHLFVHYAIYFNGNWIRDFETHSASRTFSVNPA